MPSFFIRDGSKKGGMTIAKRKVCILFNDFYERV
uniref:Uncharacterized protein n=1 Tax=Ascaris lumbricoides TaxID=6252 RepID=A0A0M3IHG2_ASCLU